MTKTLSKEQALRELEKGFGKAKGFLNDGVKLENLLSKLNRKVEAYPNIAEKISHIPILVKLLNYYVTGKYTKVPVKSIIAIISALIYFVSPIDLIPDLIPILGLSDDVAVLAICIEIVDVDILEFKKWLELNKSIIDE